MVVNARHAGHGSRWMYIAIFREHELFYTLLHSPHYYLFIKQDKPPDTLTQYTFKLNPELTEESCIHEKLTNDVKSSLVSQ